MEFQPPKLKKVCTHCSLLGDCKRCLVQLQEVAPYTQSSLFSNLPHACGICWREAIQHVQIADRSDASKPDMNAVH